MDSEVLLKGFTSIVEELQSSYNGWHGAKQLNKTPARLVRMYSDFCWSHARIEAELDKHFNVFENGYDEMLVVKDLDIWALCPHHLLPCHLRVTIGYVPKGRVLGLSKFARIAETLARRPIMQEEYSTELANLLMSRLEPKGVAVYVVGVHGCMTSRGVRQHSDVVTSTIKGCFGDHPTREEFFAICRS